MPLPTETPQPPWLLSFCDFVSCLLACFVLLYSLVAVDQSKLDKILEGVPGRHVAQAIPPSAVKRAMAVAPQEEGRNADYLASLLQAKLGHDPALAHVAVEGQGDRVLLHLSADDLLASTQPNQPAGQALVFALGGALGTLPDRIAVEVRPDNAAQFDASLSYAVRLAHRLEQAGLSGPIAARTRLTAPAEAAGVDLIVFDTGPDASGP
jgi:hypothetical protein